jgi:hypothetical protein
MIEHTDYVEFLQEFGLTDTFIRSISRNHEDYASFDNLGIETLTYVSESSIEGMGLFAKADFVAGSTIPARVGDIRTPAGRFVNHSPKPNCVFGPDGRGGLLLVVTKPVYRGQEFTLDYRQAMRANAAVAVTRQQEAAAEIHNKFQQFIAQVTGSAIFPSTSREEIRKKICQLELAMENEVGNGVLINAVDSYPILSRYAKGMYIRQISIPAGHFVIGRLHREDHYNVITKGKVSVLTEEGGLEVFTAPVSMISPAGCKRVLFTHEDTEWTTTHVTDLTDVDEIEKQVIAPSYTALGWTDPKIELINSAELQASNSAEKLGKELLCHGAQLELQLSR